MSHDLFFPYAGLVDTSGSTDATGTAARFDRIIDTVVYNNVVYVADYNNSKVRSVDLATAEVDTVATLSTNPHSITEEGGVLYVGGVDGHLYSVTTGGTVTDLYTYPSIPFVGAYIAVGLTGDGSGNLISTYDVGTAASPIYHYDISTGTATNLTDGRNNKPVIFANGRMFSRNVGGSPGLQSWVYDGATPALSSTVTETFTASDALGQRWGQSSEADEYWAATDANTAARLRFNANGTFDVVTAGYGPDDDNDASVYLQPFEVNGVIFVARGDRDCISVLTHELWGVGTIKF